MNTNDRDLTAAERLEVFGTSDAQDIIDYCADTGIKHTIRRNVCPVSVVIWRCHLPAELLVKLEERERDGVVYVGGYHFDLRLVA